MNDELISIVIPVYNVASYLTKCLESVIAQSYKNLEIIVVDDGSTDRSGKICDEFAQKDKRVRVLHKDNGGLSDARNYGINHAHGKYITFVDSDDYVSVDYVLHLFELILEYKADISVTCAVKFYEDGDEPGSECYIASDSCIFSSEEAMIDMLYRKNIPIYAWAKMYRIDLFETIKFPVGELFEDLSTEYLLFDMAERIAFNSVRDYFYLQRKNSIINSKYNSRKMIQVYTTEKIIQFMKEKHPAVVNAAISKCFITTLNLYKNIPNTEEFSADKLFAKEVLKKYRIVVLKDSSNKILTRIIAGISLVSIESLVWIGKIYQNMISAEIIKLRRPI